MLIGRSNGKQSATGVESKLEQRSRLSVVRLTQLTVGDEPSYLCGNLSLFGLVHGLPLSNEMQKAIVDVHCNLDPEAETASHHLHPSGVPRRRYS